jgi:transposase
MNKSAVASAVDVLGRPTGPRRKYTIVEKRQIAEETMQPGASVASVALRHGINANLVFGWRRLYQQGLLTDAPAEPPPLLPVKLETPTLLPTKRAKAALTSKQTDTGSIEVEFAGGRRLCIRGRADRATLRYVIEALSRR